MGIKEWLQSKKEQQNNTRATNNPVIDDEVSKLWTKCFNCGANLPTKEVEENMKVCPKCGYHFRITARERLEQVVDLTTFKEINSEIISVDPLDFRDLKSYKARIKDAKSKTNLNDAIITGTGKIDGVEAAIGVMEFAHLGGSMGSVVGEKIVKLIETAISKKLPVVIFTSSGGARMQEGIFSLMQMAKTSCAVAKLNEAKLLYITVLTEPTFGGVTASFGTLGDIIIAERGARMGFAGRRVIEQTIRQKLPSDFQTAEYFLKHGQVDMICERDELRGVISNLIRLHSKEN
ncbi:MAG: acetyl-CoA carboxylase, carboxyltransferase subunit beta [Candidatus Gastranaerophilales bacterium]|nr:acetyl-CoA carboxylase, carboxyltransferase subunit beta [Candidatus Gastranaerophilales bacterium]